METTPILFSIQGTNKAGSFNLTVKKFFLSKATTGASAGKTIVTAQVGTGEILTDDTITITMDGKPSLEDTVLQMQLQKDNVPIQAATASDCIYLCLSNTTFETLQELNKPLVEA